MERSEAEESIKDIKKMLKETEEEIGKARRNCVDYQLLWGILVLVGVGLTIFFLNLGIFNCITISWLSLVAIGAFFSYRIGKKEFRKTGIITFVDMVIVKVWVSISVGMMLIILFAHLSPAFNFALIPAFLAILVGIALFIQASLFSWRLLFFAAPLWWIGAIIMVAYPENALYFYAGLLILTYIIPAVLVKVKS